MALVVQPLQRRSQFIVQRYHTTGGAFSGFVTQVQRHVQEIAFRIRDHVRVSEAISFARRPALTDSRIMA